jgi:ribosomal protein L21E
MKYKIGDLVRISHINRKIKNEWIVYYQYKGKVGKIIDIMANLYFVNIYYWNQPEGSLGFYEKDLEKISEQEYFMEII